MKILKFFSRERTAAGLFLVLSILFVSCSTPGGSLGGQIGGLGYDAQERKILGEARVMGGLIGAGTGALIANQTDNNPWVGALLGGAAGTLLGDAVGRGQADTAKSKRVDNDSLRQAIAAARSNNDKLAAYNQRVKARIAAIRKAPKKERAKLAQAELKSVKEAVKETKAITTSRITFVEKIPPSQVPEAAEMNKEIKRGQSQLATLSSYQNDLERMSTLASN